MITVQNIFNFSAILSKKILGTGNGENIIPDADIVIRKFIMGMATDVITRSGTGYSDVESSSRKKIRYSFSMDAR